MVAHRWPVRKKGPCMRDGVVPEPVGALRLPPRLCRPPGHSDRGVSVPMELAGSGGSSRVLKSELPSMQVQTRSCPPCGPHGVAGVELGSGRGDVCLVTSSCSLPHRVSHNFWFSQAPRERLANKHALAALALNSGTVVFAYNLPVNFPAGIKTPIPKVATGGRKRCGYLAYLSVQLP